MTKKTKDLQLGFYQDGKGTINLTMPSIKAEEIGPLELLEWHNPDSGDDAWIKVRRNPDGVRGTTPGNGITHRYQFYNRTQRGNQRFITGEATWTVEDNGKVLVVRIRRERSFEEILGG